MMLDMTKVQEPFFEQRVIPCTVEVKTSVSPTTVPSRTSIATRDLLVMNYTNPDVSKYIPEEHLGQLLHQVITTYVSAFYTAASLSQVMFSIVIMFDEWIIQQVTKFVDNIVMAVIGWIHDGDKDVPLDKYDDDVEDLLLERLPFWKCVNKKISEEGPLMPIKIFRHSAQSFYSKTRGGVDGKSQTRSVLKSSSTAHKWEQKVVTHTFKTILVDAFVAWRMLEKEDLLETRDSFGDLQKYRQKLNRVQCMTDFALDTSLELLEYADELAQNAEDSGTAEAEQPKTPQERGRLIGRARLRKKKSLVFFNAGDGLELRLKVPKHPHVIGHSDIYCSLCRQNNKKAFRGYRTNHKCGFRNVHLCVKIRTGFRKSCWDLWHTTKKLKQRAPVGSAADCDGSSSEEGSDTGDPDEATRRNVDAPDNDSNERDEPSSCTENCSDDAQEEEEQRERRARRKRRMIP